jgi:HNH endonuclease/NUMOD4 motif
VTKKETGPAVNGTGSKTNSANHHYCTDRSATTKPKHFESERCAEEWRIIPGFNGAYEASTLGRIRSVSRLRAPAKGGHVARIKGRVMKARKMRGKSYQRISLWRNGAQEHFSVHRLVLETFVGPCPPGMVACHANDISDDNRLSNLRWDTPDANMRDKIRNRRSHPGRHQLKSVLALQHHDAHLTVNELPGELTSVAVEECANRIDGCIRWLLTVRSGLLTREQHCEQDGVGDV